MFKILKVRENLEIIIDTHPDFKSLNKKLLKDTQYMDYALSYKTNVKAKMTGWQTDSENIDSVLTWIKSILVKKYGNIPEEVGYNYECLDVWFAKYTHDEYTKSHTHTRNAQFAFVYYINAPQGSSPLIFTTSNTIVKAKEGQVIIFPGPLFHHVPENNCEDRVVLAGNMGVLKTHNPILSKVGLID
tara:strand:- start:970 stop:1530 length:561 start_codon:yes stop_codon:yes gene_type:complete